MYAECAGKTVRSLITRAIPERLRGVFTTKRYTNPRLPLPLLCVSDTLCRCDMQQRQHSANYIDISSVKCMTLSLGLLGAYNQNTFNQSINQSIDLYRAITEARATAYSAVMPNQREMS